ncbi:MAG: xanthine dehydrogenase family protein molybdopterin-binding subunit [Burkholderiales bacterium]|nr:xanthine dehydrogenase family protein molybdopterin-binding subunit [Burkholderiales bacterium]
MSAPSTFTGRREDRRLVTGAGRYTADLDLPGQLHAAFVRADRASARIRAIDCARARAAAGVAAVFTGADLADTAFRTPGTMVSYPGRGGAAIIVPPRLPFARDRVRFVGEEVALVLAETRHAAEDAAALIDVDYEDLPAVAHPEDAIRPGAPLVHESVPGNVVFDFEYGDEAATAAAFAAAAHVVRLRLDSQRVAASPMEPRATLVAYDAASDSFDLSTPNQGPTMMRPGLVHMLGLAPGQVRIHAQDVGGGFGARSGAYMDHVILMWAARALGRPVKWVGSRADQFMVEAHGRAIVIDAELALDADGTFRAFRMHWVADQGAYLTAAGPLINTMNGSLTIGGAYQVATGYGRHRCVLTHTCPTTAYRGAGRPDMAYAVERLVDEAAAQLGLDRIALRLKNAIPRQAMPFRNAAGATYDSGDFPALMQRAVEASDWAGFAARRAQSAARGRLRGLGVALFLEPSGGGAAPRDQAALRMTADGRVLLHAVTQNHGQGHETVFPEIVARVLGLPAERIELVTDHPVSAALMGNGVVGSRSMQQFGSAFHLGALEVVKKGRLLAARHLEAAAEDIEFADGSYRVKGTDLRVSLAALIVAHGGSAPHPLDADGEVGLTRAFPSGAHVAEVEIDADTGAVSIARYVAVDDCGNVINPTLAEAQLHGGIAQGAGQVLGEHAAYDRATGQLLSGSFMDYVMPRAGTLPAVETLELCVPSPTNVLGAKGAGEAGTTGALPVLMNAIVDALRARGIAHLDMPASPARVWQALAQARTAGSAA